MSQNELVQHITMGREIEFLYNQQSYFLGPQYDSNQCFLQFYVYAVESKKTIVAGTLDDILDFEFAPQISLRNNFELFQFAYIL